MPERCAAPARSLVLDIHDGLHCAACVQRLRHALDDVAGAEVVAVDLIARRVHLRLAAGIADEALLERLQRAGFRAAPASAAAGGSQMPSLRPALLAGCLAIVAAAAALAAPDQRWSGPLQLAAGALAALWPGRGLLRAAWRALRHGRADMEVLLALGIGAALAHAASGLLLGWPHLHADSAAAIVAFALLGRSLEARARARARAAVLAVAAPLSARRLTESGEELVDGAALRPGDRVRVRAGEQVPADGVIERGTSEIDEALLSGEALPVAKGPGDRVHAGSLAVNGELEIRVTAAARDTRLARIITAMERAALAQLPLARLADRLAAIFVPAAIALAALAALAWTLAGDPARGWTAALSVLVIACPCAFGLATPAALAAAIGRAARGGIVVRDGAALEALAEVRAVVLDKTGTLTTGRLALNACICAAGEEPAQVLRLAAAVERGVVHPLAAAIVRAAGAELPRAEAVQVLPGRGALGWVEGRCVRVGSRDWLAAQGIAVPEADPAEPGLLVQVAVAERWLGCLRLRDEVRPDAPAAIAGCAALGLEVALASGDRLPECRRVADAVGIARVHAGCSPEDKAAVVAQLTAERGPCLAIGDGINDAPMLARAAVGAAVAGGADLAALAGQLVLDARRPLSAALLAIALARATRRTILINFVWAAGYNLLALPLAMAGSIAPAWAAAAMALSSLAVLANSLRLARWRPQLGRMP
ncbi:MAG: heavy metal translocating P-type ATPase [Planctomycetota bacterium]|nr:heavy metal translocating P-type ATPase [Planctomycetota bacterium]